ncbi:hypothetical protein ACQP1G_16380 [Nocardia sp. CA-107356]|uniref:hypothetical protein n=1 Tax=Nocardia sp. CA-107356 TaxID=3239972 RepID=UPI003D8AE7E3
MSPYDPLFPLCAKRMLPGSVITLPSPWPYDVLRSWVVAPEGKQRPPLELVAEITIIAATSLPKV